MCSRGAHGRLGARGRGRSEGAGALTGVRMRPPGRPAAAAPGGEGNSMSISRKHLEIYYNFESKQWEFKVLGKNGCFVNRTVYNPENEPTALHSGSLLQFGGGSEGTSGATDHSQGVSLCFLLPREEGGGAPAADGNGNGKRKVDPAALWPPSSFVASKKPKPEENGGEPQTDGAELEEAAPAGAEGEPKGDGGAASTGADVIGISSPDAVANLL